MNKPVSSTAAHLKALAVHSEALMGGWGRQLAVFPRRLLPHWASPGSRNTLVRVCTRLSQEGLTERSQNGDSGVLDPSVEKWTVAFRVLKMTLQLYYVIFDIQKQEFPYCY